MLLYNCYLVNILDIRVLVSLRLEFVRVNGGRIFWIYMIGIFLDDSV